MPIFSYTAHNADNQEVSGTIDAANLAAAHNAIHSMGLDAKSVMETSFGSVDTASKWHVTPDSKESSSPTPVIPTDKDWQALNKNQYTEAQTPVEPVNASTEPSEPVQWANIDDNAIQPIVGTPEKLPPESPHSYPTSSTSDYYSLLDTLRLYAGWLLAWYILVYILGGYESTRNLPFDIPYVQAFLPPFSPTVLTVTLAAFLFQMMSTLHIAAGRTYITGTFFSLVGLVTFLLYRINV